MNQKCLRPNERLVYTDPETGVVAVVKLTEGATIESVLKKHPVLSKGVFYRIITHDKLPKTREFRAAWTDEFPGDKIDECPVKALDCIRSARNKELIKLDKIFFKEMRKPNNTNKLEQIDLEAQRLRDIPQSTGFKSEDLETLRKVFHAAKIKEEVKNG